MTVIPLASLALIAAACSSGDDTSSTAPEPAESTSTTRVEATTSTSPEPELDITELLRGEEVVILNVLPPFPDRDTMPFPTGMADFDLVFDPATDWEQARRHVDIYRVHAWQLRYVLSDDQLRTMFDYLDEHDIPLMLETEPLTYSPALGCAHSESFSGVYDLEMAQRISDLGGTLHAVAIEEPYHFVHLLDTPESCQWPVERIVDEVIEYMDSMHEIFPGIPVGTIEPIWASPRTTPEDMETWLDTWEERSGEPFAFLHIDPDWYRPDWPDVAVGIEAVADARDVPFGVLYNGGQEPDSESWMQFTMENVALFEDRYGGSPQHVSFQSWVDQPDRALPPDDLGALTSGIVRYFGERTRLEVVEAAVGSDAGGWAARLTTTEGTPVVDAPLTATTRSTSGALGARTMAGIVPDGASEAVIVIRGNTEGAEPGAVDARLSAISYREADGPELVVNGEFTNGTNGWGVYGPGSSAARLGSGGGDSWLAIGATADQEVFVDSQIFTVTPGAEYQFTVTFGIDEASVESLDVGVEFLGLARIQMDMTPPTTELATGPTDADGTLNLASDTLEPGTYRLEVDYDGDLDHWPTDTSVVIEVG